MTNARDPRRPLTVSIVLLACSAVFLDYWDYSRSFHANPDIWSSTLRGATAAPEQYRIGVLRAASFLAVHTPLALRHALALIDFAALLAAAFVLRALLTRSKRWRSASLAGQWFGAAAFLFLLEYSLLWLTWYQRPETLTIAALLALSLWLCTYGLPIPGAIGTILTALSLILLGLLQGVTRADVGIVFHCATAIICLTPFSSSAPREPGNSFALSRWPQLSASLLATAACAGTQLYIMRALYPSASYGLTPRFELVLNFTDHIRIVPFALFMAPTLWVAIQIVRRRFAPSAPQAALLVSAAIFLCLWAVLGKIDEVRIFLPFAFALAPLTAEAAMAPLAAAENLPATRNVC